MATYPRLIGDPVKFVVKTKFLIDINPGERLTLIGRKGQGRTAFLYMICGFM